MSKIAVLTCLNKRPEISRLFFLGIDRLQKRATRHHEIRVICAIEDTVENKALCEEFGAEYVVQNTDSRLGKKWNTALLLAIKSEFKWDRLMIMGDDDVISNEGFFLLNKGIIDGLHHVGFQDINFIDSTTGEVSYFKYSQPNKLIGCGRMLSRYAIETTCIEIPIRFTRGIANDWFRCRSGEVKYVKIFLANYFIQLGHAEPVEGHATCELWDNNLTKGLDNNSDLKLALNHFYPNVIKSEVCHMVDVKSADNIWSFSTRKTKDETVNDWQSAYSFASLEENAYIDALILKNQKK